MDEIIGEDPSDFDEKMKPETFEVLTEWIGKVRSKSESAKLNLKMLAYLAYMDDGEEDDD